MGGPPSNSHPFMEIIPEQQKWEQIMEIANPRCAVKPHSCRGRTVVRITTIIMGNRSAADAPVQIGAPGAGERDQAGDT